MATTVIRGVPEDSSRTVTFYLKDNAGVVVPLADIATAELTLYDLLTYIPGTSPAGVINGRDAQNVLNDNNVDIHVTSGLVTWSMQPEDNPIITEKRAVERHIAEFMFVLNSGVKLWHKLEFDVDNMRRKA